MNWLLGVALRCYPPSWREQYGAEVLDLTNELIEHGDATAVGASMGLVIGGMATRLRQVRRHHRVVVLVTISIATVALSISIFLRVDSRVDPVQAPVTELSGGLPYAHNGRLAYGKIPQYIEVDISAHRVGYVPRPYLYAPDHSSNSALLGTVAPVYTKNLRTRVGYWSANVGFSTRETSVSVPNCQVAHAVDARSRPSMPCDVSSIHVPDLVGMSTPEAVGLLSGLGMQLHLVDVPVLFPESGHVVSTSPIRGTMLITGQVITIDIGVPLRSASA